jgi:predicted transposase/invertase (TIGR01784 family)
MFIAAKSDEELDKVAERNAEVRKAVIKYRELTADERTRDMFERREKARRDQVSRENWARQQGIQQGIQQGLVERNIEIARNLLGMNLSSNQIITATGLTLEEIENLK